MRKNTGILFLLYSFLLLVACNDTDDINNNQSKQDAVSDFVWKGLNSWYYWQEQSVLLDDAKTEAQEDYLNFLNGYSDYQSLMLDLCYKHSRVVGSANAVDRFSWFIEDYEVQKNAFQGIRTRFGFTSRIVELNNSRNEIVLSILMVEPGSPADLANMKRGDIVYKIDGVTLNSNNIDERYGQLSNQTVDLSFAEVESGQLKHISDKSISKALVVSNPVHLTKVFEGINGKKVGYLVYNQFSSSFNDELNAAFGAFKDQGIDEMVLDLRFNGGGSVLTSSYLASMLNENTDDSQFVNLVFNEKHSDENDNYNFQKRLVIYDEDGNIQGRENINRLATLNRLYIITSNGTASASELVINGLKPYMEAIILIGARTYGKNVGSITLYDAPNNDYASESKANPDHKFAMQPIVFQTFNKDGESDYLQGFSPDISIDESKYWNDLKDLGDPDEVHLKAALDHIRGIYSKEVLSKLQEQASELHIGPVHQNFDMEMYVEHVFDELD